MTCTVLIAGSGGQGILMAGKVLAEAALLEQKNVTWYPSYGAAMRGGAANCTVVISDRPIGSPVARKVDVLIVLNNMSLSSFEGRLHPGGLLLLDSSNIKARPDRDDLSVIDVPVRDLNADMEPRKLANIFLMGAFIAKTGILSPDSISEAIKRVSPDDIEGNLRAFDLGKEFLKKSIDKKS